VHQKAMLINREKKIKQQNIIFSFIFLFLIFRMFIELGFEIINTNTWFWLEYVFEIAMFS